MSSVNLQPSAFDTTPTTTTTTSTTSSASSNSSQTSLTSLGSTFLSLLTQELQNQDPTAPMDSTAMVGQMISLNELDQTASINQLLTNTLGSSTASTSSSSSSGSTAAANTAAAQQAATAAAYAALQNGSLPQAAQLLPSSAGLPSF